MMEAHTCKTKSVVEFHQRSIQSHLKYSKKQKLKLEMLEFEVK